uniref:Nudix hydrolase domain-containing protein n=1 Tax=Globodera pallida TaxID=36090 RepID=A0A183CN12_GLOPA
AVAIRQQRTQIKAAEWVQPDGRRPAVTEPKHVALLVLQLIKALPLLPIFCPSSFPLQFLCAKSDAEMCTRASAGADCAEASGTVQQTKPRLQLDESKGRIATGDRIRDRNGFRRRAAAFCARIALTATTTEGGTGGAVDTVQRRWPPNLGALEVLMVSGRTAVDGYWVLPGGGVENMESTEEAVVRELREEAGILGKVLFCIGEFVDDQRFHHTTLFLSDAYYDHIYLFQ